MHTEDRVFGLPGAQWEARRTRGTIYERSILLEEDRMTPLCRLGFALLLLCFPFGVGAQEIETGRAIICDTQQQAERLVALKDQGEEDPLAKVNDEAHNPTACAVATMALVVRNTRETIQAKQASVRVVEIVVVAVNNGPGWTQIPPATQYTLFAIPEESA